jgi:ketosteroid isomerase-like protein
LSGAAGDNLELIRGGYAAWNRGDIDGVATILDEQVEWHGHPRLPEPGPYFGRDAVKGWLDDLRGVWEEIEIHPLAVAESGDKVVVLVQLSGRGRGSGVEVQSGIDAHVWTLAGGRATRMRWLQGDKVAEGLNLAPDEIRSVGEEALAERLPLLLAGAGGE